MKCTAAIITEVLNIYVMGTCKTAQVVSYSYITFGIICRMDNLMCMTVGEIDVSDLIANADIKYSRSYSMLCPIIGFYAATSSL